MKKAFLIAFLLSASFLHTQIKDSSELIFNEKKIIIKDTLESNDEGNHQSFSLGGGIFYVDDKSANTLPVISFSTTFQLSNKFLIELKYDNCAFKYRETDRKRTYIYSIFFQTSYNLSGNELKLYPGFGFGLLSLNGFIALNPMGIAKVEYNFNRWFSVNSEFMLTTYWFAGKKGNDSYPVMLKLNSNFKLPY